MKKGIITPQHSNPAVVRSHGGKPGPMMDKHLLLILRIMQKRTCCHSSSGGVGTFGTNTKNGNHQHLTSGSDNTLAGAAFPACLRSLLWATLPKRSLSRIHPMLPRIVDPAVESGKM